MKQNEIIYFKFPWDRIGITKYFSSSHEAIDNGGTVSKEKNKYAYLPCEAKILKNQWYDDYGYMVEYEAIDKRGTFVMASGHLKKKSDLVVGKTYPMGTIVGEIGSTGNSTGAHDHFRIALNGVRKNPLDYLYVYEGQFVHQEDEKLVKYIKNVKFKTNEEIAKEVIEGKWENGQDRVNKLTEAGYNYDEVQSLVNEMLKPKEEEIKVGDKVEVLKAINYDNGKTFAKYYDKYDVLEVSDNRVVIGIGNTVTSAIDVKNIRKVG